LVGIEGRSRSLEAAWKYVIISSLGVTIALAGTLFLFYSGSALHAVAHHGGSNLGLTWPYLLAHAHALAPQPLRLAFLLAVVGYGTKVGLAPMHTWLPDAHAEAPSPASAMLSAALLNTGMYAIIRFLAIAHARLGSTYPRAVLLSFGFASIVIGALFMVRRGNFKRLFAYSSVEHMGIIAVALGFGGTLGLYGALLQTLNHALAKAVLFLSSGDVSLRYKTREAGEVSGLLAAVPLTGGALLLASFAVLGSPPFGLFLSELTIVRAGFASASPVFPLLLLALLGLAFVAFARTTAGMVTGSPPAKLASPYRGKAAVAVTAAPLILGLAALLVLGLWIPVGLDTILRHSIEVIG
jgi:hydrogenase-4 component F